MAFLSGAERPASRRAPLALPAQQPRRDAPLGFELGNPRHRHPPATPGGTGAGRGGGTGPTIRRSGRGLEDTAIESGELTTEGHEGNEDVRERADNHLIPRGRGQWDRSSPRAPKNGILLFFFAIFAIFCSIHL